VRATGVIVRFLSLLDVALILLGVLMITLMQAQIRSDAKQGHSSADAMAELAGVDLHYLYAGWKGMQNGRCYRLVANGEVGQEVRIDTADDIQEVLASRIKERPNHIVMLLFSDDGWYSAWDAMTLARIEQTWKVKVIPVYNVQLPVEENP
jgi:hypothetical protein